MLFYYNSLFQKNIVIHNEYFEKNVSQFFDSISLENTIIGTFSVVGFNFGVFV